MAIVYPVEIKDVLKIQDGPLTGNLKPVMDGTNTASPLRLSTTEIELNGKVWPTVGATTGKFLSIDDFGRLVWVDPPEDPDTTEYLPVAGGTIAGDLVVEGNFSVQGTQTFNNVTASGNLMVGGNTSVIGNLATKTTSETVVTIPNVSGTVTITPNNGSYFTATVAGSTTFVFNAPGVAGATGFILEITNGGSQNVFWPSSVKWPKSIGPALSANSTDIISFLTRDNGITWFGTFRPGA